MIAELEEVFYLYKNESEDNLTDEELLAFMKRHSLTESAAVQSPIWEETCLERFARAVRAGYRDYVEDGGSGRIREVLGRSTVGPGSLSGDAF